MEEDYVAGQSLDVKPRAGHAAERSCIERNSGSSAHQEIRGAGDDVLELVAGVVRVQG
ncbi:hypothetical protein [Arthrobacter sp. MP_M7]|uniref:hypothetical protein n=1 Tax=Arthrobacter sp. MP_M7 TaxID=3071716 RepID=UPI002E03255B|nr:hypothetical protein [Arthrobacter sp. MP_M7]